MNIRTNIIASFLGLSSLALHAQNSLYVKDVNNVETVFALSDISKITFPTGNMVINKTDKTEMTYALANVGRMSFVKTITSLPVASVSEKGVRVFPNPVVEALQIGFAGTEAKVSILDANGVIVKEETMLSESTINVSDLANGVYVCRVQSNGKIENVKFVK